MIRALHRDRNPSVSPVQGMHVFYARNGPIRRPSPRALVVGSPAKTRRRQTVGLINEIAGDVLLMFCFSATSARCRDAGAIVQAAGFKAMPNAPSVPRRAGKAISFARDQRTSACSSLGTSIAPHYGATFEHRRHSRRGRILL